MCVFVFVCKLACVCVCVSTCKCVCVFACVFVCVYAGSTWRPEKGFFRRLVSVASLLQIPHLHVKTGAALKYKPYGDGYI
jgi:hypothetical protein